MGNAESSGAKKTISLEEQMKVAKDTLKQGLRELDREKRSAEREERKYAMEAKKVEMMSKFYTASVIIYLNK